MGLGIMVDGGGGGCHDVDKRTEMFSLRWDLGEW